MAQADQLKAQRIIYLTAAFINGKLTSAEQRELEAWQRERVENHLLFEELTDTGKRLAAVERMQRFNTEESLLRIRQRMNVTRTKEIFRISPYWYAAASVVVIGFCFLLYQLQSAPPRLLRVVVPYGK